MRRDPIIEAQVATEIWKILVDEAGAYDNDYARESFVHHQVRGCTEYRFGGKLGFGGKFWNNAGRWYVNGYIEDETRERNAVIERTNERLAALRERLVGK